MNFTRLGPHYPGDDVGQRPRGRDRRFLARGDDGAGDPAGMPLFAENVDDIGEIGLRSPRDHIRRGGAIMAHPHVERAAEAKREAALGLVELHRGHPDIHHDAVDRINSLSGANPGEIRKFVLDQSEPAVRSINQIESARNSRSVAVDADDSGSGGVEDRPAVAAGPKGGIDINAAVAGAQHLHRLAAKDRNMAGGRRIHAPAPEAVRQRRWKLDANGPIAPQMSVLRRAFRLEKPVQGTISGPSRPISQALSSTWNLLRCHGISSVNRFAAVPQTGSARHHLVTAVSIKKALMRPIQKPRRRVDPGSGPKAGLACPGTKLDRKS